MVGESPRVKIPWQEYILQHVKVKRLKGKSLGSLVKEEIEILYEKSKFALEPEFTDQQIRTEVEYIKEAYDHHLGTDERTTGD